MDFFVNFAELDDTVNMFRNMAGQYGDAISSLNGVRSLLDNGGFIGECGANFGEYINRDLRIMNEYMELMGKASQSVREMLDAIQEIAEQLQSIMPG